MSPKDTGTESDLKTPVPEISITIPQRQSSFQVLWKTEDVPAFVQSLTMTYCYMRSNHSALEQHIPAF